MLHEGTPVCVTYHGVDGKRIIRYGTVTRERDASGEYVVKYAGIDARVRDTHCHSVRVAELGRAALPGW